MSIAGVLFFPAITNAHEDVHEHGRDSACFEMLPVEDVVTPNFTEARWSVIFELKTERIHYVFYRDKQQPKTPIASVTAEGINESGVKIKRVTWQVNGVIRTFRPLIDTMICQKSLIGEDGNTYDLEDLKNRLLQHFLPKA